MFVESSCTVQSYPFIRPASGLYSHLCADNWQEERKKKKLLEEKMKEEPRKTKLEIHHTLFKNISDVLLTGAEVSILFF